MLKILVVAAVVIVVVIFALFVVLAQQSRTGAAPGLIDGRLAPCPDQPNCVSSETGTDAAHRVVALDYAEPVTAARAWRIFRRVVEQSGGVITRADERYLAATFRSRIFGFVDDLEARLDESHTRIQIRSAARVGRSDFGANRARVAAIARRYAEQMRTAD